MATNKFLRMFLVSVLAIGSLLIAPTAALAADANAIGVTQFAAGDSLVFDNAIDSQGNVYTATIFKGSLTVSGVAYSSPSANAVLVTKSTAAMVPIWSKFIDTQLTTGVAVNIRVTPADEIVIGGMFSATTLTVDGLSVTKAGTGTDAYLAKFSSSGTIQWLKSFGSAGASSYNGSGGLAVGPDGSTYARMRFGDIVGASANALSPYTFSPSGTGAAWVVVKFNSSGSVVWAKQLPSAFVASYPLDVNAEGKAIVSGHINGPITFPIQGTFTPISADGIIIQLSADGTAFDNVKIAGGSGNAKFNTVRYLSDGSIVAAMEFSADTVINGVTYNSGSAANLMVIKFSGSALVTDWTNLYAGTGTVSITHVTSAPDDSIYVAVGSVGQAGFANSVGGVQSVLAFEKTGANRWIKTWDSPSPSYGFRIATTTSNLYIGGQAYANTDFGNGISLTRSAAAVAANGADGYLVRFSLPLVQTGPPSFMIQKTSSRVVQPLQSLKISGISMSKVKSVQIGSQVAEILNQSDEAVTVKVPQVAEGIYDLKLIGDSYHLSIQSGITVKPLLAKQVRMTVKAKLLSSTQAAQIQNLVAGYRSIASITCTANSKALAGQACQWATSQRPDGKATVQVKVVSSQAQTVLVEVKGLSR